MESINIDNKYSIKLFKDYDDTHLQEVLNKYTKYTKYQIKYHLDTQYNDSVFIFGFFYANKIIGYCYLMYFQYEKFMIVDELVIDKEYSKNHQYSIFIDLINKFFKSKKENINIILIEHHFKAKIDKFFKKNINIIKLLK